MATARIGVQAVRIATGTALGVPRGFPKGVRTVLPRFRMVLFAMGAVRLATRLLPLAPAAVRFACEIPLELSRAVLLGPITEQLLLLKSLQRGGRAFTGSAGVSPAF